MLPSRPPKSIDTISLQLLLLHNAISPLSCPLLFYNLLRFWLVKHQGFDEFVTTVVAVLEIGVFEFIGTHELSLGLYRTVTTTRQTWHQLNILYCGGVGSLLFLLAIMSTIKMEVLARLPPRLPPLPPPIPFATSQLPLLSIFSSMPSEPSSSPFPPPYQQLSCLFSLSPQSRTSHSLFWYLFQPRSQYLHNRFRNFAWYEANLWSIGRAMVKIRQKVNFRVVFWKILKNQGFYKCYSSDVWGIALIIFFQWPFSGSNIPAH